MYNYGGPQVSRQNLLSQGKTFYIHISQLHKSKRKADKYGCGGRYGGWVYQNPGPNAAWHGSGYDKLKLYGPPIHGLD